jgi:hypothetical protein
VTEAKAREFLMLSDGRLVTQHSKAECGRARGPLGQLLLAGGIVLPPLIVAY